MLKHQSLRQECCDANRSLARTGLVDITFGNVSVFDDAAGILAIKPSGVEYDALRPEHIVLLDLDGAVIEGELRPSSDTPTHRCLIRAFPGIRSVVHTHSRRAVAFAQAGRAIPIFGTTHADYFRGPVPVTRALTAEEISGSYEWATGEVIVETMTDRDPMEVPAVLVRNHGPFVWASSGAKAVEIALALEVVAQMAMETLALAPDAPELFDTLRDKHFFRKHGAAAYYGQTNAL
jgi:L-ribulose-5-phosphate 4-epimerase